MSAGCSLHRKEARDEDSQAEAGGEITEEDLKMSFYSSVQRLQDPHEPTSQVTTHLTSTPLVPGTPPHQCRTGLLPPRVVLRLVAPPPAAPANPSRTVGWRRRHQICTCRRRRRWARSGLPLIPCPECGAGLVEEYIPAGDLCERCREDAGAHGGCSFFKTEEEYKAILRDRGLLGPAEATPEQGKGGCHHLTPGPSGFLIPVPVGNTKMAAAVEDLKHEMGALNLAIAQLTADISKGMLGAGDKAQKVAKTDLVARWGKAIVKWFFEWFFVVVLLSGIVVAMSVT